MVTGTAVPAVTTDGDTVVPADWLVAQVRLAGETNGYKVFEARK